MTEKKTGVFYVKNPSAVVVVDKGLEIARYDNVTALIEKHKEGLYAIGRLEENMNEAIESHYTPYPPESE